MIALPLLFLAATAPDPYDLQEVLDAYSDPHVTVTVEWARCNEVNAWYRPDTKTVVMCNELRPMGRGFVRFTLAHELAHAVIHQLAVPVTGSEEVAADELASAIFAVNGWGADLMSVASVYGRMADVPVPPWDPHPTYGQRAWTLMCAADEATGAEVPAPCDPNQLSRSVRNWGTLIRTALEHAD